MVQNMLLTDLSIYIFSMKLFSEIMETAQYCFLTNFFSPYITALNIY